MSVLNGLKVFAAADAATILLGDTAAVGSTDGAVTLKLLVYFATPL